MFLSISCLSVKLTEEFMHRVVTQDETWVHHFDPEAKKPSIQWSTLAHPLLRNLREFLQQGR